MVHKELVKPLQMSFWAEVFWANAILGKCLSGQMSSGQMSIWANVFLGKCLLGKCRSGQMSFWANVSGQLRADTSVRVKWQPQPKQYADARGRSQSKSVLLPYQASGQDQWISSSGGEDGCVEHYPYQASGYDQRIRSSMGGRPSVK
jgi:hypothetical protein